jgi:hypothetical protein
MWQNNSDIVAEASLSLLYGTAGESVPVWYFAPQTVRLKKAGESLGLSINTIPELIRAVMHGFSYQTLVTLETNSSVSLQALAEMTGIPERTLARRKASGRLAPEESERLLRLSSIFEKLSNCLKEMSPQLFTGSPRRSGH